jgi:peptidyl-prolyl cis-trans isomerase B (cyclophilin B)
MRGSHRWSTLVCSVATLSLASLTLLAGPAAAQDNKPAPAESREVKPKPEVAVDPAAPYKHITFAKGEKPRVVVETTMGKMVLELWPDVAPKHCQSFVYLVGKNYYDSVSFHRIIPGFVIQGGDPQGTGMGGPGYTVPAEFSDTLKHDLGILSMARTPDPNSAGSQFFICLSRERTKNLDKQYTIFGKVVEGLEVVEAIGKVKTGAGDRPVTPVLMTKVYMEPKG